MSENEAHLKDVYAAGGDASALSRSYDGWAQAYDADMSGWGYRHPAIIAGMVGRHAPSPQTVILDAGCGTGVLGETLAVLGYTAIDGIDLSEGMLRVAGSKGCYRDLKQQMLGEVLDFATGSYDAIVSSGVMTPGHAPATCLHELARILKPGGHMILTITEQAWADSYGAAVSGLVADGTLSGADESQRYVSLPGAPEAERLPARVHVLRRT
ncbi:MULTISPECIES: class I SAM-dependent methyltransferase [unclassified Minwuia]|uniref:class I SAM-dependent DNA methyltransferase n=1 Tax=unclassified Minwuia TaxID=2618799 RepID=UPI0024784419|nr:MULTISPECIES: class I SAM-dependent methyltransferase [unclassified Minwuia]